MLGRERGSPEDLPDSGCTGLLDEEDEDNCSLQRAGSSSTAGEQAGGGIQSAAAGLSGAGVSCDRDSGGGSVASSCAGGGSGSTGGYQQRSTTGDHSNTKEGTLYVQVQKRKSVNGNGELPASPLYPHQLKKHLQQQLPLLHVDGPLDGSPYAVINPLVKHKALADSGISVRESCIFYF